MTRYILVVCPNGSHEVLVYSQNEVLEIFGEEDTDRLSMGQTVHKSPGGGEVFTYVDMVTTALKSLVR